MGSIGCRSERINCMIACVGPSPPRLLEHRATVLFHQMLDKNLKATSSRIVQNIDDTKSGDSAYGFQPVTIVVAQASAGWSSGQSHRSNFSLETSMKTKAGCYLPQTTVICICCGLRKSTPVLARSEATANMASKLTLHQATSRPQAMDTPKLILERPKHPRLTTQS